jgi:hypothetical protein
MKNLIKAILVELAINDKLPLDMNNLDADIFDNIPSEVLLNELKNRKYVPQDTFTILDVESLDETDILTLEERFDVLNNVFSDELLMSQINYDLESEFENYLDEK